MASLRPYDRSQPYDQPYDRSQIDEYLRQFEEATRKAQARFVAAALLIAGLVAALLIMALYEPNL